MKKETSLTIVGKNTKTQSGTVNPPIHQTSTILFPTLSAYADAERGKAFYDEHKSGYTLDRSYAIGGTPTSFALQEALCELEGGDACVLTPSGLSAITSTLFCCLSAGDHMLVVDTIYGPTRRFCTKDLKRFGVEVTYYDPAIGSEISDLIQDNTKVIFLETPGSLTFELQDIPAIVAEAKKHDIITIADNSWATPLFYNPLDHGVDICIHAVTKYIAGHSDVIMGAVITKGKTSTQKILKGWHTMGQSCSPHDCYAALRGLRSLSVRMRQHQESAMKIADWLTSQKEVTTLLYPPHPASPGHKLWKRDFSGGASLISIILDKTYSQESLASFIDNLKLFGIGASWGGFESLAIVFNPAAIRTATKWNTNSTCLRFYIGLENADDLIADLSGGFARLRSV